jgi:hypothetical protein
MRLVDLRTGHVFPVCFPQIGSTAVPADFFLYYAGGHV